MNMTVVSDHNGSKTRITDESNGALLASKNT